MTYRFRVGVKNLENAAGGPLGFFGYNHACILLNKDLFEYGCQAIKKMKTYERHKDVGRDSSFDWDLIGNALNGTTHISPDQLETAIKNDGQWAEGHYNVLTHNCHDFVRFCLDRIGCPESMICKVGPCFKKQPENKVQIKSKLANKNLDINENKIENGTKIILWEAHDGENQKFKLVNNPDGTVTFKNKGYAIDVQNGEAKDGAVIQIYESNNTAAQKFYLVHLGFGNYYTIHSAINPLYVIDVCGAQATDGNKIQLWKFNFTDAQKFKIVKS